MAALSQLTSKSQGFNIYCSSKLKVSMNLSAATMDAPPNCPRKQEDNMISEKMTYLTASCSTKSLSFMREEK